ncbi:DNA-binding response regulator [Paenibacillus antri]|uniref:DNA-binding response regulator n=1 Tax=Paenibacillus antri TaxID=2582848 RepID=A0A5R9GJC6_9BACL|nr:DNA-binding response regulator [Paenibacillus antri]TLS53594.1 DNA-binding response regulator [Paenibacillus antri]
MDKGFAEAHGRWLEQHKQSREGERLRRLVDGHAYLEKAFLEKVWWPAFGTLDDLHPEYEVSDYNDGRRYIDHAYKPNGLRLALEADGFNPHIRDIERWDHADNVLRDLHLTADGWTVLHFSSDVIKYRSRQAQQLLRQIVWGREGRSSGEELSLEAREVLRFLKRQGGVAAPKDIIAHLGKSPNTVRKAVHELAERSLIRPVNPHAKVARAYEVTQRGRGIGL